MDTKELEKIWDHSHIKHFKGVVKYDNWLNNSFMDDIITNCNDEIIDLGCGQGNNTLYLIEKNKNVISCDISNEALKIVKNNIKNSNVVKLNMLDGLPFVDNFTSLIISDLSLQYFSFEDTKKIIKDLKRVIKPCGHLILRLSSTNDINYGAMQGVKLEENYYFVEKRKKRYYDLKSIETFFEDWNIVYVKEEKSKLERYDYERSYFIVVVKNEK